MTFISAVCAPTVVRSTYNREVAFTLNQHKGDEGDGDVSGVSTCADQQPGYPCSALGQGIRVAIHLVQARPRSGLATSADSGAPCKAKEGFAGGRPE